MHRQKFPGSRAALCRLSRMRFPLLAPDQPTPKVKVCCIANLAETLCVAPPIDAILLD